MNIYIFLIGCIFALCLIILRQLLTIRQMLEIQKTHLELLRNIALTSLPQ